MFNHFHHLNLEQLNTACVTVTVDEIIRRGMVEKKRKDAKEKGDGNLLIGKAIGFPKAPLRVGVQPTETRVNTHFDNENFSMVCYEEKQNSSLVCRSGASAISTAIPVSDKTISTSAISTADSVSLGTKQLCKSVISEHSFLA